MRGSVTSFRIEGLHGRRNINIPIQDNRLVLVGENGTGKSTVANLLYYLLTRQWRRIKDYRFTALEVEIEGSRIRVTHEDVEALLARQSTPHELRHLFPAHYIREFQHRWEQIALFDRTDPRIVEEIVEETGIPVSMAHRIFREFQESQAKLPKRLLEQLRVLEAVNLGQFLYLPTYRRIEQDLKSIFRGIEIEEKIREFRERFKKRERTTFIELIEFGMEDVENTIHARMAQIKESVRTGLSNLTGTYLREVIRGLHGPADVEVLRSIDPKAFQSIFARIDEAILPASDKNLLENKISEIAKGYSFGSEDKVIAHFLSKLVSLYKEQQINETDVRDFVQLCNEYLTGKRVVYDDINYSIYIRQTDLRSTDRETSERLELKMLSSGEKQIVSLFSHMYLSGEHDFFLVIDEPELSLSVPWQQRFLPDIINTGRCTGIIAVTHSPFIWENDLESYVRPLAEFVELAHVLR